MNESIDPETLETLKRQAPQAEAVAQHAAHHADAGAGVIAYELLAEIQALRRMPRDEARTRKLIQLAHALNRLRSGDHRRRKLELEQQRELWKRCDEVLRWAKDPRVQQIVASDADYQAKIEALGKLMFGDVWRAYPKREAQSGPT